MHLEYYIVLRWKLAEAGQGTSACTTALYAKDCMFLGSLTCFSAHYFHSYPGVFPDPDTCCLKMRLLGAYAVLPQGMEKIIPPANLTDFRAEKQNSCSQKCRGKHVCSFWLCKLNTHSSIMHVVLIIYNSHYCYAETVLNYLITCSWKIFAAIC